MDALSETPTQARDYAALNVAWAAALTTILRATAREGKEAPPATELPVLGLATFALAKALSKEKVGVWARSPVVEQASDGQRRPRGRGVRYVLGELVTCSRCMGTWSSLGLLGLRVARPREGRIVASVLAVSALNDMLQTAFSFAAAKANATESGADVAASQARHIAAVRDSGPPR